MNVVQEAWAEPPIVTAKAVQPESLYAHEVVAQDVTAVTVLMGYLQMLSI